MNARNLGLRTSAPIMGAALFILPVLLAGNRQARMI